MLASMNQFQAPEDGLFPTLSLVFFLIAICHALLSDRFLILAHRHDIEGDETHSDGSFAASFYFFMGNITCIFGLWLIPICIYLAYNGGINSLFAFVQKPNPTEAIFNFVMITIALTKPLRHLFANLLRHFGFLFKNHLLFWWLGSFFLTTLFSGLLSEIAVMALQCTLLSHFFYNLNPSKALSYFTLGLLLVCVAFGNTVIPFNLEDIFTFHSEWGWTGWSVFYLFGWKSFLSVAFVTSLGAFYFRDEFASLQKPFDEEMEEVSHHPVNFRLLFYLSLLIIASLSKDSPYLMFATLITVVFLHKKHYRSDEEGELHLRLPLLIAFFTYTLEIYGSLQSWWVKPILDGVEGMGLFVGSFFLTGLNENVPIHAVETVLQKAPEMDKFLSYLGIVAGGGVTFFANSANILAKKTLSPFFEYHAISPIRQMLTSIPIAIVVSLIIFMLNQAL